VTTIFERIKSAMDTLSPSVPHALAPYKGATLPDTYVVYQLLPSGAEQHADGAETERSYLVQVTVWSKSGLISLPNVDSVMIAAGFMKSSERQLPQDKETFHYGLAIDYLYL